MEIVLGVIAGLEAIIIVVLLVYLIRNKKQMGAFIEQAQEIKKRRIDLDDIEIKDQNREQMIMADAINAIKKGIISAAIGQDPFGQGHDPIVWMFNSIVTGKPLPSDNMKCRANVVDKNNVDSLVGV